VSRFQAGYFTTKQKGEKQMSTQFTKRSIGKLRPTPRTKPKSPDGLGKFAFQRSTLMELVNQMQSTSGDEIICNIAGWMNTDSQGRYLTIELSPLFPKSQPNRPQPNRPTLDQFLEQDDDNSEGSMYSP
jgi:hypothetical protein